MDPYFKLMGEALAHQTHPVSTSPCSAEHLGDRANLNRLITPRGSVASFFNEQDWRRSILKTLHDIRSQHPERERGEAAGDVGLNVHNSTFTDGAAQDHG